MSWLKSIFESIVPLFTDVNPDGKKKVSIGRAPLLMVLITLCYRYFTLGEEPGQGVLAFIALAMAYNGFSKTGLANRSSQSSEQSNITIAPDEEGD